VHRHARRARAAPTLIIKVGVSEIVKGFQGLWIEILERADGAERCSPQGEGTGSLARGVPGNFRRASARDQWLRRDRDVIGEVLSVSIPRDYAPPRGDVTDEHEISAALERFFADSNPAVRKSAEIEYGKLSINHCPAPESAELSDRARAVS